MIEISFEIFGLLILIGFAILILLLIAVIAKGLIDELTH